MRAFSGILKRELLATFATPLAWVALGAFALVTALLFWLELLGFEVQQQRAMAVGDPAILALLDFNDLLIGSTLLHAQVLLIFVVPVLTMRLIAEEQQRGTLDFLLAAPVRSTVVVGAKLVSLALFLAVACALLLVYPALLSLLGRAVVEGDGVVDWGQALLGIAGVFATGLLYAALGLAVSAGTASPAAAALVTALLLVGLWFVGGAGAGVPGAGGAVLSWLAPATHLERGVRGVLALGDVLYFVVGTVALEAVAVVLVESRRRA
ncbi:MAG: ABC transporter permease subunit [Deltaproteobacteria bacterium]|nr:ABC transporter permease subunit [Deltaproteobacteria bacterium]